MRRKMTIFAMIKAPDGSIWADIGEEAIGSCEVCDVKPAVRYECLSGRWQGARVVACCKKHAAIAIERFISASQTIID